MFKYKMNQGFKAHRSWLGLLALGLLLLIILAGQGNARASADANTFSLDWWTVDGGGGKLGDPGGYQLTGTVGQTDAGGLSGGSYTLYGGFWAALSDWATQVFLPLVIR
jgi:hypothetical protein